MPFFERRIRVRGYEMNATGRVPAATLARYGEHVRWEGLRNAEYGLNRYWQRGVIRAQRLQTFAPARYGSELNVRTWVARVGKTSFQLANRLQHENGELVALVAVTVVNLGSGSRPSPVARELESYVRDEPLPDVPPPERMEPRDAFVHPLRVAPSDQDVLGHVNHARYIDFVEDTRCLAWQAGAYGERGELVQHARRLAIEYDAEATFGTELQVVTWAEPNRDAYHFQIRRAGDGAVLTRAQVSLT
ncbi:MAG TPA: acyl-CoA thioesterase [Polyangiaceae bacterium]|nr:acyl-CoA thioesterase [Polyangiaceae bacterium]